MRAGVAGTDGRAAPASPSSAPAVDRDLVTAVLVEETSLKFFGPEGAHREYALRKQELLRKVTEDEAKLDSLRQGLARNHTTTKDMLDILNEFDARLHKLESNVRPIRQVLQELTTRHDNLVTTIDAMGSVLHHFDLADVEAVINAGVKHGALQEYLHVMDRVVEAQRFITSHKQYKSAERLAASLRQLALNSISACVSHLTKLLKTYSKPVIVNVPALPGRGTDDATDSVIPGDILESLKCVVRRLETFQDAGMMAQRGGDQLREKSMEYIKIWKDHRIHVYEPFVSVVKDVVSDEQQPSSVQRYTRGSNAYIRCIRIFRRYLEAESRLTRDVLPDNCYSAAFADVIEPMVQAMCDAGQEMARATRRSKRSADVAVPFELIDVVGAWDSCMHDIEAVMATLWNAKAPSSIRDAVADLRKTAIRGFSDFRDSVRRPTIGSARVVSADGTVAELTSNTLNTLKRMFEFQETIERLLAHANDPSRSAPTTPILGVRGPSRRVLGPAGIPSALSSVTGGGGGSSSAAAAAAASAASIFGGPAARPSALSGYIVEVLTLLHNYLEAGAAATKARNASLASLFLMNNFHHILKTVRFSELSKMVGEDFHSAYQALVQQHHQTYLDASFGKLVTGLKSFSVDPNKALSSRDKNAIKSRFSAFNAEFDALFQSQRRFSVPDDDLRKQLRQDVLDYLLPAYKDFLQRYADLPFTSKKPKYVVYPAKAVENTVRQSFFAQVV